MQENETLALAQHIFTTGKMIHDRVLRVQTAALAECDKKEAFGDLSVPQFHMIMTIRRREQVSMTELSCLLGVSPPSTSAMVDRLTEKGILTREHSVEDRRKVVVRVSSKAIKDIKRIEDTIFRSFIELVEKIGPETARKWSEALERVKSVLEHEN